MRAEQQEVLSTYSAEIISHVVWLYFRFALSFRDIEELMASRGILVTYETICQWTLKFGQVFANKLRQRQPQRGDKWHLDEVVLTIKGKHHYLWRAVDQNGHRYPDAESAQPAGSKRFFRRLLKGLRYATRVTDEFEQFQDTAPDCLDLNETMSMALLVQLARARNHGKL